MRKDTLMRNSSPANNPETIVEYFLQYFLQSSPAFAKKVAELHGERPELFTGLAAKMLAWAESSLGEAYPERLVRGYEYFVTEVNRAQLEYEKSGHYRYSRFDEVEKRAYASQEFMEKYHWGVFISTFAWRHHLEIYEFFKRDFLSHPAFDKQGTLLDLGCGSGVWTFLTLSSIAGWDGVGVDISPTSVAWAEKTGAESNLRCDFRLADATAFTASQPFQAGISCFLLEHLERPTELLSSLARNLEPGAPAFVTGAVTAAEVDHIYEFKRESELVAMAEECGFVVEKMLSASPSPFPRTRKFKPRSVALILTRKTGEHW